MTGAYNIITDNDETQNKKDTALENAKTQVDLASDQLSVAEKLIQESS